MKRSVVCAIFTVLLAACGTPSRPASSAQQNAPADKRVFRTMSNGQAIFLTGYNVGGRKITAATPPLRQSCAACHGQNGAGGVHLPGGAISADLRHKALVTDQGKRPYTLALLERAISAGIDNQDEPLNRVMPRWKLSSRDLHDVAQYVLTQLK